jgi:hypothetical protein
MSHFALVLPIIISFGNVFQEGIERFGRFRDPNSNWISGWCCEGDDLDNVRIGGKVFFLDRVGHEVLELFACLVIPE